MRTTTEKRTSHQKRGRKHLASPTVDLIVIFALVGILLLAPYIHLFNRMN